MKVLKFGASAVSSVDGLLRLKEIVDDYLPESVVVVVSALEGVTDELIAMAEMASQGHDAYQNVFMRMCNRHEALVGIAQEYERKHALLQDLHTQLDELSNIYKGIYLVRDLSPKTLSTVMSYGERLASLIVKSLLKGAKSVDSRDIIKTERRDTKNVVDFLESNHLIADAFVDDASIYVVPGFIASDRETGEVTHLGRGGSDYSASIIAAAVNASSLHIWTNVDGFMTADPKVIHSAYVIEHLTYVEAMELCNFGVKAIYPPSIYPVYHKKIPIIIHNFQDATAKATRIDNMREDSEPTNGSFKPVRGISSIDDTCLITVRGLGMVGVVGVNYRIFKALADAGISVFLVSQTASENNTSIAVNAAVAERAAEVLRSTFKQEIAIGEISEVVIDWDLATVAIVGEQMRKTPGVAGKLYDTLGRNGINVVASAQGASEMNISFVIRKDSLKKAIHVIHDSFFLLDYQVLNLFISGVGLVGKSLIEQIRQQQAHLLKHRQLKINVVGLANSKHMLINREGIDLSKPVDELLEGGARAKASDWIKAILDTNMFNSVFVDCTASAQLAGMYQELLDHNVSVVAANKVAASSDYDNYALLKRTARRRGVKFLFETNVGAGLPIINTINSLRNSGDRILKIEAVVSGTLNYIFNELSESIPLSKAIRMAQEAGYAEPDPRLDLNGSDVIRKLVILAREAGYRINQEDVVKNLFIPSELFEGSIEEFWKAIPSQDALFEERRNHLVAEDKRLRFVASFGEDQAEVALQEVDSKSPFYELEGSNNVILLTTERYKDYPMEIKGYGAGASVTAAGVFADIISIANIR